MNKFSYFLVSLFALLLFPFAFASGNPLVGYVILLYLVFLLVIMIITFGLPLLIFVFLIFELLSFFRKKDKIWKKIILITSGALIVSLLISAGLFIYVSPVSRISEIPFLGASPPDEHGCRNPVTFWCEHKNQCVGLDGCFPIKELESSCKNFGGKLTSIDYESVCILLDGSICDPYKLYLESDCNIINQK